MCGRWTCVPAIRSGTIPIRRIKGSHIGNRGVGMWKDWLYFMSPDGHLVCLNAKTGKLKWDVVMADYQKGYWTSMSPLVVGNHVLVGVSGDFDNLHRLPALDRSRDREEAVAMGQHSAAGHARRDHRRHDVDDRNIRSRR